MSLDIKIEFVRLVFEKDTLSKGKIGRDFLVPITLGLGLGLNKGCIMAHYRLILTLAQSLEIELDYPEHLLELACKEISAKASTQIIPLKIYRKYVYDLYSQTSYQMKCHFTNRLNNKWNMIMRYRLMHNQIEYKLISLLKNISHYKDMNNYEGFIVRNGYTRIYMGYKNEKYI